MGRSLVVDDPVDVITGSRHVLSGAKDAVDANVAKSAIDVACPFHFILSFGVRGENPLADLIRQCTVNRRYYIDRRGALTQFATGLAAATDLQSLPSTGKLLLTCSYGGTGLNCFRSSVQESVNSNTECADAQRTGRAIEKRVFDIADCILTSSGYDIAGLAEVRRLSGRRRSVAWRSSAAAAISKQCLAIDASRRGMVVTLAVAALV